MKSTENASDRWSTLARRSVDAMGLGRTAGQRSAELVAGLRAELMPSPLTSALCRLGGRLAARIVLSFMRDQTSALFLFARSSAFGELVQRYLSAGQQTATLVEIGAGFSPLGFQLAESLPHVQVIEVDLPDVIDEKQQRLRKAHDLTVPPNLSWRAADLKTTPLSAVLDGQPAHIVVAEGLNPYLAPEDITRVAAHVRESLLPGGVYLCDIGWEKGRHQAELTALNFYVRQTSVFRGIVKDEKEAGALLTAAGYPHVDTYLASQLAPHLGFTGRVIDFSVLLAARRAL